MKFLTFLLFFFPFAGKAQSALKYEWRKIAGPEQYRIVSPHSATTNVTNLVAGVYKFELKVTNSHNLSSRDTMVLTVNPPWKKLVAKNETAVATLGKL